MRQKLLTLKRSLWIIDNTSEIKEIISKLLKKKHSMHLSKHSYCHIRMLDKDNTLLNQLIITNHMELSKKINLIKMMKFLKLFSHNRCLLESLSYALLWLLLKLIKIKTIMLMKNMFGDHHGQDNQLKLIKMIRVWIEMLPEIL